MATFFSGEYVDYWDSATNRVYGTLTGDVSRSGDTVTLSNLRIDLTPTVTSWGTSPWSFTVGGSTTSTTISAPPTTVALNDYSFPVSPTQTQATVSWRGPENSGSFTVSFPSSAPSGLSVTNITPDTESFSATVSITAWNGGNDTTRYRELQVWTYSESGLVQPRRYEAAEGSALTSSITVNNNSLGSLTITPNTRYVIGGYATNGDAGTDSQRIGVAVTLAEKPTVELVSTTSSSATIRYSLPADGGFYPKTIEYSLNGGTTWNTVAIVTSGGATSATYTIAGLTPGEYNVLVRSRTTSGSAGNVSLNFRTAGIRLISSDGTTGKEATRFLASVNGVATEATRLLVSQNGIATENV